MSGTRPAPSALLFSVAFTALAALVAPAPGAAEGGLNALVSETQRMSPDPDRIGFVWWLPTEFWEAAMANDPSVTEKETRELVDLVRPYLVVGSVDGKLGPFGGADFLPLAELRRILRVRDAGGTTYSPLPEESIPADLRNLLAAFRPVLAGIVGPMGENMHFFVFPAGSGEGGLAVDAKSEGSFAILLGDEEYVWRLPLGSVMPEKTCPVDGEKLNGAWSYCPWHGERLEGGKLEEPKPDKRSGA